MINEASFRKRHRCASGGPTLSPADGEPARLPFTIRQIGRQLRPFKSQREQVEKRSEKCAFIVLGSERKRPYVWGWLFLRIRIST
ncbi:hypothetical protein NPIL_576061 [Nephila pilipes]|uniref:Uncharacterized protein n=1 Tax=Nephila pilipes TaxID=299642 RepID=A0A8X6MS47_NEPPI|nr:hypothetical protein NPIL_576061 [Nephila pilipes]